MQINAQSIISPDFTKGQRSPRPLPPPGNEIDGSLAEDGSANYRAQSQVTTITLGGSTVTSDVTTLTIVPTKVQGAQPWTADLPPIVVTFETAGTQTLAAVAAGLDAALAAAQTVSSLADLGNLQRVRDVVEFDSDGVTLVLTAADPSVKFSYTLTSTGSVTHSAVTDNADQSRLNVGIVVVSDGLDSRGYQRCAAPTSGKVSADILGVSMDGASVAAANPGDSFKLYRVGADVRVRRLGTASVYGEKACTAGSQVYARKVASGSQVAGAVTDTPTFSASQVVTITPTPANSTVFKAHLVVSSVLTGAVVASADISMTSDGDATAAEIVTGLKASLSATIVDQYITDSGTDTLILTMDEGYEVAVTSIGAGTLDPVITTAAAADHILYRGAKFIDTTSAAGSQAIRIVSAA